MARSATLALPMWTDEDTLATADDNTLRLHVEYRHRSIDNDEEATAKLRQAIAKHEESIATHKNVIRIVVHELNMRNLERRRSAWMGTKLGMCVVLLQSYMEVMRLLPATAVRLHRHKAEIERDYDGVMRLLTIRQDGQVVGHNLNLCTSDPRTWNCLFLN